jgi:hypothetical protein
MSRSAGILPALSAQREMLSPAKGAMSIVIDPPKLFSSFRSAIYVSLLTELGETLTWFYKYSAPNGA